MNLAPISPDHVRRRARGYLPHWERNGAAYFVTFRLADSLPQHVLRNILNRRSILAEARQCGRELLPAEHVFLEQFSDKRIEDYLDQGAGTCDLARPDIAELVSRALKFFEGGKYELVAWCVMPNHVHTVVSLRDGTSLSALLRSWKSYTGKRANELLGRSGPFWQREYYDRIIRNGTELNRAVDYVFQNPEKAGLPNWKWRGLADGL